MKRVNYGTVGIVGLGLVGGSIGLRLKEVGVAKRVIGFDVDTSVLESAEDKGCVDQSYDTLNHLADADILIIAVPPNQVVPCLVEADIFCKVNCIVTDTSSVKGQVVQWTSTYPLRFGPRFVGGHPMVGSESGGVSSASADLFAERTWVLTPTERTDGSALDAIKSLVLSLGAKPVILTPEEHDRHAAILDHIPHALAGVLIQMGANLVHPEIAGPAWDDLTRVAGQNPELWANVFSTNREQIVSALEDLEYLLKELRKAVDSDQQQALLDFFEASRKAKIAWHA